jgi:hypothetical protein
MGLMRAKRARENRGAAADRGGGNHVIHKICRAVSEVRYGSVEIHIQDGKVVQIDKTDKVRMR